MEHVKFSSRIGIRMSCINILKPWIKDLKRAAVFSFDFLMTLKCNHEYSCCFRLKEISGKVLTGNRCCIMVAMKEYLASIISTFKRSEKLCETKKDSLISDSRYLCHEYIEDRLIRSGLHLKPRKNFTNLDNKPDEEYRKTEFSSLDDILETLAEKRSNSFELTISDMQKVLMYVGECLEMRHINVYTDVMSQTNLRSLKESSLRRAHTIVAQELFNGGISWCKIISLFAFAGALAVDCVLNGSSLYVRKIENWTVEVVENRLVDWIYVQGGWVGMFDHFLEKCVTTPTSYSSYDTKRIALVSTAVILPIIVVVVLIFIKWLNVI